MDTRSEPSSTSVSRSAEGATPSNEVATREGELIEQDGKRYSRIPADEAFRIRFDVQLYYYHLPDDRIWRDYDTPESYRRAFSEDPTYASAGMGWWKHQTFYIEIAPDREEYVPHG